MHKHRLLSLLIMCCTVLCFAACSHQNAEAGPAQEPMVILEAPNGAATITLATLRELAAKGEELRLEDFEDYPTVTVDSGYHARVYCVEGGYNLGILSDLPEAKQPISATLTAAAGAYIDIREDGLEDFLATYPPQSQQEDIPPIEENLPGEAATLTLDTLRALASKGQALRMEDFAEYPTLATGSGLHILLYAVEGGYSLSVGGGLTGEPLYASLTSPDLISVDIRAGGLEDFLAQHPPQEIVE